MTLEKLKIMLIDIWGNNPHFDICLSVTAITILNVAMQEYDLDKLDIWESPPAFTDGIRPDKYAPMSATIGPIPFTKLLEEDTLEQLMNNIYAHIKSWEFAGIHIWRGTLRMAMTCDNNKDTDTRELTPYLVCMRKVT